MARCLVQQAAANQERKSLYSNLLIQTLWELLDGFGNIRLEAAYSMQLQCGSEAHFESLFMTVSSFWCGVIKIVNCGQRETPACFLLLVFSPQQAATFQILQASTSYLKTFLMNTQKFSQEFFQGFSGLQSQVKMDSPAGPHHQQQRVVDTLFFPTANYSAFLEWDLVNPPSHPLHIPIIGPFPTRSVLYPYFNFNFISTSLHIIPVIFTSSEILKTNLKASFSRSPPCQKHQR